MENEQIDITKKCRFSSFLDFREINGRTVLIWRADPKLQRNIQCLVELNRDITEESWARIFLIVVRAILWVGVDGGQNFAKQYLSAYLQITCHFVAIKLSRRHSSVEVLRRRYTYQDYFQIASSFSSQPVKLLQNFKFDLLSTVQAYAQKRLEGLVTEEIRRENKDIWPKYRDWGLLRNVRKTELETALRGRVSQNRIEPHLLAWQCFKEIYVPKNSSGSRKLTRPTNEEFQQIGKRYNQRRVELFPVVEAVDKDRVEQMLDVCIQAVTDGRKVHMFHPDANRDTLESTSCDRWDVIPQDIQGYPSNEPLFKLEQEEEWNHINTILSEVFDQLPVYDQNLLRLYFGLEATQAEIAEVLNLQQYQVYRQLKRCKRLLLKAFAQRSRETLNLHFSNEIINQLDAPIDDWLEKHCKNFLSCLLETVLAAIGSENKTLFQLLYRDRWSQEEIALELQIPIADLSDRLASLQKLLATTFVSNFASTSDVNIRSAMPLLHRIADFITVCSLH